MRVRSGLLALLIACGSTESAEEVRPAAPVPAPTPTAPLQIAQTNVVALPEIATVAMPLDQVPSPWTLTASDGSGLVATRVEAKAVLQGPLAFTELHLHFANTENRIREGTFAITLPAGAAISRFAMETDGQWMEAEVVEKHVARRAYEDFLHRKQDPALMEKAAGNQFTARVFPIAAKSAKHIVLSFSQELPGQRYVLPLRGLPKVAHVDVHLATTNPDGSRGEQTLSRRDWQPDVDFVSNAATSAEAISSDTVVIAQVSAFDQATVRADVPKAMTILVDTSASRALGFTRYASNLRELISSLGAKYQGLTVDVIAFDQDTQAIYSGPATGFGTAHVDAMIKRGAAGASDISQAVAKLTQARERLVIITDGVITAGASGTELAAKLKAAKVGRVDVAMVGGIRDAALATAIVTTLPKTGAVLDLDQRLGEVTAGLGESVLTQVPVEVAGASWVYPRMILSARPNQRTMVYARFDKPVTSADITVGNRTRTVKTIAGTPALIDRAAAAAEIVDLEAKLDQAKGDEAKAMRATIVKKAIAARVISSQTSMLVLESDGDYARYGIDRKALADILVVGPKGVEQRNRTMVAIKRYSPPPPRPQAQDKRFALKDTTDRDAVMRPRDAEGDSRARGGAVGMSRANGISVDEAKGVVSEKMVEVRPAPDSKSDAPAKRPAPDDKITPDAHLPPPREIRRAPPQTVQTTPRPDATPPPQGLGRGEEQFPPPDAPPPLRGKLAEIDRLLKRGKVEEALAKAQAWHDGAPGDVLALIGLGEALEASKNTTQAARIYGSIIDLFPGRADLRRFAGERLERIGDGARWLAVDTYRRAVAERPDHMTGHRLLAYALLRSGKHADALAAILKGVAQRYPSDRFEGGLRVLSEDAGMIAAAYLAAFPDKKTEILDALKKHRVSLSTRPSTRFIMYWETDTNDVDFHIQDARGGHAFYSEPKLASGGELYADITTGYGPECFAIHGKPWAGPYKISINYYSQGPMGYGMGLLQIVKHDGKGSLEFQDRPYVIMNNEAYVNLGTFK